MGEDILGPVDAHLALKKYIPVKILEETFLSLAREENMEKYCYCKCFWDGTSMLACNGCTKWFHIRCVGVSQEVFENQYSGQGKKKGKQFYCKTCAAKKPSYKYPFKQYVAPSPAVIIQKALDELNLTVMGEDAEILATLDAFKDLWPNNELLINRLDQGQWIEKTTIKFDLN